MKNSLSKRNRKRPVRKSTQLIVLHTTEGAGRGALEKVRKGANANYLVMRNGTVHRIIDKHRVANHAGRSMWNGREWVDRISIGIEIVGYHNKPLRSAQIKAVRELLTELQSIYAVPDERVLTHSMVAYGSPNRYHRYRHRGRKRCGMNMGSSTVRRQLGLTSAPKQDPDVRSGRLRVADRVLHRKLYGKAPQLKRARKHVKKPAPRQVVSRKRSKSPRVVDASGRSARAVAGRCFSKRSSIYLFSNGLVRTGADLKKDPKRKRFLKRLPRGTRVLLGYQFGGYVKANRPPSVICGARWDDDETLYRLPTGKLVPGDRINAARLPRATMAFCSS